MTYLEDSRIVFQHKMNVISNSEYYVILSKLVLVLSLHEILVYK